MRKKKLPELKNAMVLAKNTSGAVTVKSGVDIGIQDIMAVAIARGTAKINKRLKDLGEYIKSKTAELNGAESRLVDLEHDAVRTAFQAIYAAATPLLSTVKRIELEAEVSRVISKDGKEIVNICGSLLLRSKASNAMLTIENCTLTPSKEIMDEFELTLAIKDKIKALQEETYEWRRRKSNVPELERQVRARIVENQLAKMENGQEILDSMLANFDSMIDEM
jgi:hypothetical protein